MRGCDLTSLQDACAELESKLPLLVCRNRIGKDITSSKKEHENEVRCKFDFDFIDCDVV